jgi:HNH endonuclease.
MVGGKHREIFLMHAGVEPWDCFFKCGQPVYYAFLVVHHINHDHTDNVVDNLTAAHSSCHTRYHSSLNGAGGRANTPAQRAARVRQGLNSPVVQRRKEEKLDRLINDTINDPYLYEEDEFESWVLDDGEDNYDENSFP